MSRRNRFRKNPDEQSAVEGKTPQSENRPPRLREGVVTLKLGGRNPVKAFNAYLITGQKHVLVDPGPPCCLPDSLLGGLDLDVTSTVGSCLEEIRVLVFRAEKAYNLLNQGFWDGGYPVALPLAAPDVQGSVGEVKVCCPDVHGLGDAEAAGVDELKEEPVFWVCC